MIEVKADALEASFEAVEKAGVPAARPMLAGGAPSATMFESFLRSGGGGVEMKAFTGLIDALVRALKAAGVWAKLDLLYLTAAHDAQAARRNWIGDAHNLSTVSIPAFTADRGYAGDGVGSYLDTGWLPSAGVQYALNSGTIGCWINGGADVASDTAVAMGATSATGQGMLLVPRGTSGPIRGRINQAMTSDSGGATASRMGFTALSRTSVLDHAAPELKRANLPVGWAAPAFDVLQLEDYDWASRGNRAATARGIALAEARLGYPAASQHYFAGFVLTPEDAGQWQAIDAAAEAARARGVAASFVWALPQVMRDGFVHFDAFEEDWEEEMQAFDDVLFPIALGREAEVAPEVSTAIVTSSGGAEKRNADWAEARTSYDVGPGVRSEADIAELLAFFRARIGPARGFRLRDPFDFEGVDEVIGVGNGEASAFPLVKHYGEAVRRITRPVSGSVSVSVDGVASEGFTLSGGVVTLDVPPDEGAAVTASFLFDVPVRFAEDRLSVSRATFLAGAAASVKLVEIRE